MGMPEPSTDRRPTVADAFGENWSMEAEALFEAQLKAEERGDEPCYFCGSWHHHLTECEERP